MTGSGNIGTPPSPSRLSMQPPVNRQTADPMNVAAADGMEAMFLDYMMKVMRDTVPKSEMSMRSPATEIYQSMLDSETAQKAVRTGGVGLSDLVLAYLERDRYTGNRGQEAPSAKVAEKENQP